MLYQNEDALLGRQLRVDEATASSQNLNFYIFWTHCHLRMGSLPVCQDALDNGRGTLEPMAIIGMATRLPQEATSNENLWKFLLKARSAHTPFPKDRINSDGHYHPDPEHGGTVSFQSGFHGRELIVTTT